MDNFASRYQPKSLADFIFGNEESLLQLEDIVSGDQPFPFAGQNGLLLYGTYGTGKTTLAKLLPQLIEKGQTGQDLSSDAEFFGCQQGHSSSVIADVLKKQNAVVSFNASGKHYYVFDEVDNLTKSSQASLKTTLNNQRGIFILTTNNISQLDRGVKDRCILIEMNAAADSAFLPIARQIACDFNVVLSDMELLKAISGRNGSLRQILNGVSLLAARVARQSASANSIAEQVISRVAVRK